MIQDRFGWDVEGLELFGRHTAALLPVRPFTNANWGKVFVKP